MKYSLNALNGILVTTTSQPFSKDKFFLKSPSASNYVSVIPSNLSPEPFLSGPYPVAIRPARQSSAYLSFNAL